MLFLQRKGKRKKEKICEIIFLNNKPSKDRDLKVIFEKSGKKGKKGIDKGGEI